MKNSTQRDQQVIRFLKWIREYPGLWEAICTPNNEEYPMNLKKMQMLVEKLRHEGFYELIYVLLTVHRNEPYMEGIMESLLLDTLIRQWPEEREHILAELVDLLE